MKQALKKTSKGCLMMRADKVFLFIGILMFLTSCMKQGCTEEYAPVCCDGKTYGNQCMAQNEKAFNCIEGRCEEECVPNPEQGCPENYDPYCCDGKTYGNYCKTKKECAKNCILGECGSQETIDGCRPDPGKMCMMEYRPVCCDGKTYGNRCVASANCGKDCVDGEC
jgi:coxsackievirus/adenovirus receptor